MTVLLVIIFTGLVICVGSGERMAAQSTFLDWRDWYPVDRGQSSGERALNWWVRENAETSNEYYLGQSTWNIPGVPAGFPTEYNGETIDYFVNWGCDSQSADPGCEGWEKYREFMSQGAAYANVTYLEHWARGTPTHWEVYFSRDAFQSCDAAGVTAVSDAYLRQPENKEPFVMRLPAIVGESYVSSVICAVTFHSYEMTGSQVNPEQTGLWFVVNHTLDRYEDADGHQVVMAENRYYTDNPQQAAPFDNWCQSRQNSTYCTEKAEGWIGLRRAHDGITGHLYAFERYWMREVPEDNRLLHGFGAFHWWTWPADELDWDDTQVWQMDVCSGDGSDVFCADTIYHIYLPTVR